MRTAGHHCCTCLTDWDHASPLFLCVVVPVSTSTAAIATPVVPEIVGLRVPAVSQTLKPPLPFHSVLLHYLGLMRICIGGFVDRPYV